jgi:hypothetical protein
VFDERVKTIFDKSIYTLDTKVNLAHHRFMDNLKEKNKEDNVKQEIYKHAGLNKNNVEEQQNIMKNMLPILKI